jgi:hypothetical protein
VPIPVAETPPAGLDAYWLGVWRHVLKVLKEQGTWAWEQRPLVDEYVFALRAARQARLGFEWLDALEAYVDANSDDLPAISWTVLGKVAGGMPAMWDKHAKRASALADQLALTPRGRKVARVAAKGDQGGEQDKDPFGALDELDAKRQAKAG